VLRGIRFAYLLADGKDLSTTDLVARCYACAHMHGEARSWHREMVRRAASKVANPVGRAPTRGRPMLWRADPARMELRSERGTPYAVRQSVALPTTPRTCSGSCCTLSVSIAVNETFFAPRQDACIRSMFPHTVITGYCEATMLRIEPQLAMRRGAWQSTSPSCRICCARLPLSKKVQLTTVSWPSLTNFVTSYSAYNMLGLYFSPMNLLI
jgi:hypothetical protein